MEISDFRISLASRWRKNKNQVRNLEHTQKTHDIPSTYSSSFRPSIIDQRANQANKPGESKVERVNRGINSVKTILLSLKAEHCYEVLDHLIEYALAAQHNKRPEPEIVQTEPEIVGCINDTRIPIVLPD